ncbi:MAG: hypothetical protein GXX91_06900 [Verrucomicrobiaceae bacterium]|nr:hypothetical protein [Verrucomicrobiaceae bacterium]
MLRIFSLSLFSLIVSCQTKPPYAPPPRPALVESVAVEVGEFGGRPDVSAVVSGHLSSTAALLVDPRQSREGQVISLEVLEQTPRATTLLTDLGESPPFETRIPIGTLGLEPGRYTLAVNGLLAEFEIPPIQASLLVPGDRPGPPDPAIVLVDEFIPIQKVTPTSPSP